MLANGLHRIRWRRLAVARVHWTAASQFARDLVNIQQKYSRGGGQKCRQTDSIGSDRVCLPTFSPLAPVTHYFRCH